MKKTINLFIIFTLTLCVAIALGSCINTEVCKHEEVEEKNAREATESEVGYTGDTYCKLCGLRTAAGEEIPMLEHIPVRVERVEPTCTKLGKAEHYECSSCGKIFSDADGANEISKADLILTAAHEYEDGICRICGYTEISLPELPETEGSGETDSTPEKEDPPAPDGEEGDGDGENTDEPDEDGDNTEEPEEDVNTPNEPSIDDTDPGPDEDEEEIPSTGGDTDGEIDVGGSGEGTDTPPTEDGENGNPEEDGGNGGEENPPIVDEEPTAPDGELTPPPSDSEGKDWEDQEGVIGRPGILPTH